MWLRRFDVTLRFVYCPFCIWSIEISIIWWGKQINVNCVIKQGDAYKQHSKISFNSFQTVSYKMCELIHWHFSLLHRCHSRVIWLVSEAWKRSVCVAADGKLPIKQHDCMTNINRYICTIFVGWMQKCLCYNVLDSIIRTSASCQP